MSREAFIFFFAGKQMKTTWLSDSTKGCFKNKIHFPAALLRTGWRCSLMLDSRLGGNDMFCFSSFLLKSIALFIVLIGFSGCDGSLKSGDDSLCAGSKNARQVLAAISANQNIRPVSASGRCKISWFEKGRVKSETPDVRLRFVPPYNIYFAGTILGQESFRLGLNDEQFWYRMKPIGEYYYGSRLDAHKCKGSQLINPATLLEAIGIVSADESWKFTKTPVEDILTKVGDNGKPLKKIFVDKCSSHIVRVQYFDKAGKPLMTTVLGDYVTEDGLTVPSSIDMLSHKTDGMSLEIDLKGVKLFEPTPKQLNGKLFKMPSMDGFDKIYEMNDDCRFIRK